MSTPIRYMPHSVYFETEFDLGVSLSVNLPYTWDRDEGRAWEATANIASVGPQTIAATRERLDRIERLLQYAQVLCDKLNAEALDGLTKEIADTLEQEVIV